MTNDQDQKLVARLAPDNASGILKELPSLPTRQALLLGLASEIPILIDVPDLPEQQRPQSEDPKFWEVWTGKEPRPIDWARIVRDWTGETEG